MSLWLRIKWWVEKQKSKLPAWVLFALVVFKEVPDLFDATKFWLETAKAMGGKAGLIATVVDSPWFSVALILMGIAWLRFVGESRYVVRHPALPLLGWMFVGVIALAFWSVLVAGYVASRISQQAAGEEKAQINSLTQAKEQLQKDFEVMKRELQRQTSPWVLTEDQKSKLKDALGKVPLGTTYKLNIHVIPGCSLCSVYTNELGDLWKSVPGWEVKGSTNFGLNPGLIGVNVVPDIAGCPPEELQFVMDALTAAGITYGQALSKGLLGSECLVLVGTRP